jgi:hypothetical protein
MKYWLYIVLIDFSGNTIMSRNVRTIKPNPFPPFPPKKIKQNKKTAYMQIGTQNIIYFFYRISGNFKTMIIFMIIPK